MKFTLFLSLAILLFACGQIDQEKDTKEIPSKKNIPDPIDSIELAHAKDDFLSKDFVQFDIVLEFGGTERLNGTMTLATNSTKGRITYKSGKELYFDQDKVYADSLTENASSTRFAAYTWSYFFLFPYKLSDPGTQWSDVSSDSLKGKRYHAQKLTFESGTGDAPDDWYIAYSDTKSHLIEVAAYIVTAGGTTVVEAEEDPHAISYLDYQKVNGIPLAHSWKFWEWREDSGLTKQLGNANLTNFRFLTNAEVDLSPPSDFIEIK